MRKLAPLAQKSCALSEADTGAAPPLATPSAGTEHRSASSAAAATAPPLLLLLVFVPPLV